MQINKFLKSSPIYTSYFLSEKVFNPLQKRLKSEDLTFIQSMILAALYFENNKVYPSDLSKSFGCTRSNISHAIKVLNQSGYLNKSFESNDGRKILLTITPNGRKKAAKLIKFYNDLQNYFEQKISEQALFSWNQKSMKVVSAYNNFDSTRSSTF